MNTHSGCSADRLPLPGYGFTHGDMPSAFEASCGLVTSTHDALDTISLDLQLLVLTELTPDQLAEVEHIHYAADALHRRALALSKSLAAGS